MNKTVALALACFGVSFHSYKNKMRRERSRRLTFQTSSILVNWPSINPPERRQPPTPKVRIVFCERPRSATGNKRLSLNSISLRDGLLLGTEGPRRQGTWHHLRETAVNLSKPLIVAVGFCCSSKVLQGALRCPPAIRSTMMGAKYGSHHGPAMRRLHCRDIGG
jgi:hypothetical protein